MMRNVAFIVIGLLVAAGVAYGIITLLPKYLPTTTEAPKEVAPTVSTLRVMVANNPIPKGRQVGAQDFIFMDYPAQKDANGNVLVPGWISLPAADPTQEETKKNELNGQFAQYDIPPFAPLSPQQFGPVKPPEPVVPTAAPVDAPAVPIPETEITKEVDADNILLKKNVIEFPLVEAGTLSSAGTTQVDVVLVRKADLVSGGEWTVSEPILRNVKLQREEGDNAGPAGVTFYAELANEDEVTKVKLARAIGTVRLEPANPVFRPRGSQICIDDRCYQPEAAPEEKILTPDQPVPGFGTFGAPQPGIGPDGMMNNMQPGGSPTDQQLQNLVPGGAAPPGTAQPMPGQGGATFAPGQPAAGGFQNQQPAGFNQNAGGSF